MKKNKVVGLGTGIFLIILAIVILVVAAVGYNESIPSEDALYKVTCDVNVKNYPLVDASISDVTCESKRQGIFNSMFSFWGLKDEGYLVMSIGSKSNAKDYGVWENQPNVIITLSVDDIPIGQQTIEFDLYNVEGNKIDELTKSYYVGTG
jgi:hypothetical protein